MSWLREEVEKIVRETALKSYTLGKVIKLKETTVDVEPTNGDPVLYNVKLQVNTSTQGWAVKPKLNSDVLVGHIDGSEKNCFVAMFSEVDSVMINGDVNGGLTITPKLVAELNKNNQILSAILSVINAPVPIATSAVGTPDALAAALKTALTGKVVGDFTQIENKTVTHG